MTEDKLDGLFDEIRKESAQTSISEVDQWIETAVAGAAAVGLLATLKLFLIKKPLIMWTTLLTVTGGASLGVALILNKPAEKKEPKKEVVSHYVPASAPQVYREKEEVKQDEPETPMSEEPVKTENPNIPEDLGAPVPLKYPEFESNWKIPAYRIPQTTESFTKVHVSGALSVELSQGNACSILVEPETAKDLVRVEIQKGTLYLKNEPNKKDRKEKVVIKVTVQDLTELRMSGATNLITHQQLELGVLSLELDGASDATLNVKATKIKGNFSGASDIDITGTCESIDLDVSGASEAKLGGVKAKSAKVDNSGAAHVEISVSEEVKIDGSGASSTYYTIHGDSKNIRTSVSTSGAATAKKK
ncbi:hypothetical protein D3C87_310270 [compost metagenome]